MIEKERMRKELKQVMEILRESGKSRLDSEKNVGQERLKIIMRNERNVRR